MRLGLKKILHDYFNRPTAPFWTFVTCLAFTVFSHMSGSLLIRNAFAVLTPFAFVGISVALLCNLIKKRWGASAGIFCSLIVATGLALMVVPLVSVRRPVQNYQDTFGKDIVIPPDLQMAEPLSEKSKILSSASDPEGAVLVNLYSEKDTWPEGVTLRTDIHVLDMFTGERRNLLLRHLATSAKWFLSEEYVSKKVRAHRRFSREGRWINSLNGYYDCRHLNWRLDLNEGCQMRIALWPDGPPAYRGRTQAKVGSGDIKLKVRKSNSFIGFGFDFFESHLILESAGLTVEIQEDAATEKRPFTVLALSQIETELTALMESSLAAEKGFDRSLMPPESIKSGEPEISIFGDKGTYHVYAYVNPRERGTVYLKAFEHTKNTPLSVTGIQQESKEYVGWSPDLGEQFFYNTNITIGEGDWGTFYPARFELWFVPQSGEPEKKLIEKIFKIEGWQR